MYKLDPIERLPDGSLFRLTPGSCSVRGLQAQLQLFGGDACCWTGLPAVSPAACFAGGLAAPYCPSTKAGTGHSQPEKTPPLRSLRHGYSRPLRQDKILPRLRQGGSPPAEGKIRPQTAVWCRQFGGEKPLNCKHSRTAKAARQYDFPRSHRNRILFVYIDATKGDISMDNILTVPIHLKMTLTAREAAEYSNIGINKIDSMLRSPNCPFVLFVGTKKLVKRREFEEYISQKLVI